jgi:hypothetical protein
MVEAGDGALFGFWALWRDQLLWEAGTNPLQLPEELTLANMDRAA